MKVRPYRSGDLEAVVRAFTHSVHVLAAEAYDSGQRAAWAPEPPDLGHWQRRLKPLTTLVADAGGAVAGFISFEENGHIQFLYTAPAHSRRGVASLLYSRAEAKLASLGAGVLFTEASLVARPFFERQGFRVTEEQNVSVRGKSFQRYLMHKIVAAPGVLVSGEPRYRTPK